MERYRIYPDQSVYFLTYSVVEWLPVFISDKTCSVIVDSLLYCQREKNLRISAYVIMPTHMHLIAFDREFDSERLTSSLADFRKFTGRRLCDMCGKELPACFADVVRSERTADRTRRFWQPSRHPEAIYSENFLRQKLDYLHENPCRKGLVRSADQWRYSSAAYYLSDGKIECDVPITPISW